jgi:hypothetical protein
MPPTDVTASRPRPTAPPPARPPLEHLTNGVRERPFVVACVAAGLVGLLALTAFTPHYETNDDTTMNLIAAGLAFADRPDEHLVFTNVLIGLPLQQLYLAAPRVPWYGMYEFATTLVAAAALVYAMLRVNPSGWQVAAAVLFLAVAVLPSLVAMQFTRTAALAAIAGLALLLAPLRGASPWPRAADWAGCALLVWGSLIRFESLLITAVMFLPVAAVAAYAAPRAALRRAIPASAALAVAVALYFVNVAYYARDEGWKDFYAYNAIRARFTDYGRYLYTPESKPAFDAAGWDEIDYWMLMNWFYADRDRYSLANLQAITAKAPASPTPTLANIISQMVQHVPQLPGLPRLMLAVPCVACLTVGAWRRLVLPAVLFGLVFAVVVLMTWSGFWVPDRVASSLFFAAMIGITLQPGAADPPARPGGPGLETAFFHGVRVTAGVMAACLVVWSYFGLTSVDEASVAKRRRAEKAMKELNARPDQLFVVWREYFPFDDLVFPLSDPATMRPFKCVSMSWVLPTPFTERRLAQFDIGDIYTAVCDNPKVYVLAMPGLMQQLIEYVRVHYDRNVVFHYTYGDPRDSVFQAFQPGEAPGIVVRSRRIIRAGGEGSQSPQRR